MRLADKTPEQIQEHLSIDMMTVMASAEDISGALLAVITTYGKMHFVASLPMQAAIRAFRNMADALEQQLAIEKAASLSQPDEVPAAPHVATDLDYRPEA